MKVEICRTVDREGLASVKYYLFSHGAKEDQYGIEVATEEESHIVMDIDMELKDCLELFGCLVKHECSPRHLTEVVHDYIVLMCDKCETQIYQQTIS